MITKLGPVERRWLAVWCRKDNLILITKDKVDDLQGLQENEDNPSRIEHKQPASGKSPHALMLGSTS